MNFFGSLTLLTGWNQNTSGNPILIGDGAKCVVLSNQFSYQSGCALVPHFYWTLADCSDRAVAVCMKNPRNIGIFWKQSSWTHLLNSNYFHQGCIIDNGRDYSGVANVSQSGLNCMSWSDARIRHASAQAARKALATSGSSGAKYSEFLTILGSFDRILKFLKW